MGRSEDRARPVVIDWRRSACNSARDARPALTVLPTVRAGLFAVYDGSQLPRIW